MDQEGREGAVKTGVGGGRIWNILYRRERVGGHNVGILPQKSDRFPDDPQRPGVSVLYTVSGVQHADQDHPHDHRDPGQTQRKPSVGAPCRDVPRVRLKTITGIPPARPRRLMVDFSDMQTGLYHRVVLRKRSSISGLPGHQRKSVLVSEMVSVRVLSVAIPLPGSASQNQDVFSESFLFDVNMI